MCVTGRRYRDVAPDCVRAASFGFSVIGWLISTLNLKRTGWPIISIRFLRPGGGALTSDSYGDKLRSLRTSLLRLWLSERLEIKATITGILIVRRKSLTPRSGLSESPEGRALKRPSSLSDSLKRSRHFAALSFAHLAVLKLAENTLDLFVGSLK
jgi:hypothetical protein